MYARGPFALASGMGNMGNGLGLSAVSLRRCLDAPVQGLKHNLKEWVMMGNSSSTRAAFKIKGLRDLWVIWAIWAVGF